MARRGIVQIGTSGWHYAHWKGPFYPESLPASRFLEFYSERFGTVEINNSFYRLPSQDTFSGWREAAPEGFMFSVKASRFITHMKKLREPEEPLDNLYDRVEGLRDACGPLLFQLPPRWRYNGERFRYFLDRLHASRRHAFEFRDPTWYNEDLQDALKRNGAAFCIYDLAGHASPEWITADFAYLRLHGPGDKYAGRYTTNTLESWAERIEAWSSSGLDVYVYFDNDEAGYAPLNALELKDMLGGR
jgi:uncharacterized protein YecE (DUF72 family)